MTVLIATFKFDSIRKIFERVTELWNFGICRFWQVLFRKTLSFRFSVSKLLCDLNNTVFYPRFVQFRFIDVFTSWVFVASCFQATIPLETVQIDRNSHAPFELTRFERHKNFNHFLAKHRTTKLFVISCSGLVRQNVYVVSPRKFFLPEPRSITKRKSLWIIFRRSVHLYFLQLSYVALRYFVLWGPRPLKRKSRVREIETRL